MDSDSIGTLQNGPNTERYEQAWKHFTAFGDRESFRFLFDELYQRYCKVAYLFLKNKTDAEDVVVDVFLNIWKFRDSSVYKPGIESYLYRAVKNRSLNKIRDNRSFDSLDGLDDLVSQYGLSDFSEEDILLIIKDAINSETEKCRKVFELSRRSGMTNKDIADRMNLSEKSVEAYITRALKVIRTAMKKHYLLTL